jgi:hypothetical protein
VLVGDPTCAKFVQPAPWQRSTRYPVTPTLSVEAVQARFIDVLPEAVAESPVGWLGGVVSLPEAPQCTVSTPVLGLPLQVSLQLVLLKANAQLDCPMHDGWLEQLAPAVPPQVGAPPHAGASYLTETMLWMVVPAGQVAVHELHSLTVQQASVPLVAAP